MGGVGAAVRAWAAPETRYAHSPAIERGRAAAIDDLAEMHRLRYRIFKERLGWDVQVSGDMEVDEFDACRPVYLLQRNEDGRVQGCVRLLPTTGPNMLRDTFPALLDGQAAPTSDTIWESSRFGVDLCSREAKTAGSIARATYELFAGMIEFGLMRKLTDIVTVTDARMERILCRALAFAPSRLAAADRKNNRRRRLPRGVSRAASVRPGSRASGRRGD
jgi:N-acyl-L-homoserine lactone synthetase